MTRDAPNTRSHKMSRNALHVASRIGNHAKYCTSHITHCIAHHTTPQSSQTTSHKTASSTLHITSRSRYHATLSDITHRIFQTNFTHPAPHITSHITFKPSTSHLTSPIVHDESYPLHPRTYRASNFPHNITPHSSGVPEQITTTTHHTSPTTYCRSLMYHITHYALDVHTSHITSSNHTSHTLTNIC